MGTILVDWFMTPRFCEDSTGLLDVLWSAHRRKQGDADVNKALTRQEAYDLASDAAVTFAAFDVTAEEVIGTDYSDDDEDQRKALWRSALLVCPENPGA